ncbi:lytic transglycosylase domain-containing protein [Magnetococcales bacterium HHB-1]
MKHFSASLFSALLILSLLTPVSGWGEKSTQYKQVVESYKKKFARLASKQSIKPILNRNRWPKDNLLTSYLEFELLFHPDYRATPVRLLRFLKRWPNHPQKARVERLLHIRIVNHPDDKAVLRWFDHSFPHLRKGKERYLKLLIQKRRITHAKKVWRKLYRAGFQPSAKINKKLKKLKIKFSAHDKEQRVRAFLKKRAWKSFSALVSRFAEPKKTYFLAMADAKKASPLFDRRLKKLPKKMRRNAELWDLRIEGFRKNKQYHKAWKLLAGKEGKYISAERRRLLRYRLGRSYLYSINDPNKALIVLDGTLREVGGKLSDTAWLAGWSAYQLGRLETALEIFTRLAKEGKKRERRAQGAYWAYRILKNLGQDGQDWLRYAARFWGTFYGFLAKESLSNKKLVGIKPEPYSCKFPVNNSAFNRLVKRLERLKAVNRAFYNDDEIRQYAKRARFSAVTQMCLAMRYGTARLVLKMAKEGKGPPFAGAWYPVPKWQPKKGWKLDPALIWGLMRQESLFFHRAQSRVGALGLMQLMPATAKSEARLSKFPYSSRYHLQIPELNMELGQSYLYRTLRYLKGDLLLSLAGYNAGPGRAKKWSKQWKRSDPVLFIENIPFTETRNYVKKVMLGMAIYQLKLYGSTSIKDMIHPNHKVKDWFFNKRRFLK